MTDADKPAFLNAFAGMCIALREKEPDATQLRVYFNALKDLEIEWVQMGAAELAKTATWFPKTSDWRDAIQAIERRQRRELADRVRKIHLAGGVLCSACDDTGMAQRSDGRYGRCECQSLRKLEVMGRRPMPALPADEPTGDPMQETRALAMARSVVKGID